MERISIKRVIQTTKDYLEKMKAECPDGVNFHTDIDATGDKIVYEILVNDGVPFTETALIEKYFKLILSVYSGEKGLIICCHQYPLFAHYHIGVSQTATRFVKGCWTLLRGDTIPQIVFKEQETEQVKLISKQRNIIKKHLCPPDTLKFIQTLFSQNQLLTALNKKE